jgi:hypothetical protein
VLARNPQRRADSGKGSSYDLREQKLAQILSKLLGLRDGHFIDACVATSQTGTVTHSGCLGEQVRLYMEGKIRGFRGSGSREQEEITLGRCGVARFCSMST